MDEFSPRRAANDSAPLALNTDKSEFGNGEAGNDEATVAKRIRERVTLDLKSSCPATGEH